MASKKAIDAMISEDWDSVKEIIVTTSWTPPDLEEQHWVLSLCTDSLATELSFVLTVVILWREK